MEERRRGHKHPHAGGDEGHKHPHGVRRRGRGGRAGDAPTPQPAQTMTMSTGTDCRAIPHCPHPGTGGTIPPPPPLLWWLPGCLLWWWLGGRGGGFGRVAGCARGGPPRPSWRRLVLALCVPSCGGHMSEVHVRGTCACACSCTCHVTCACTCRRSDADVRRSDAAKVASRGRGLAPGGHDVSGGWI